MAQAKQAKTKAPAKRARGNSKPQPRSRGSTGKSRNGRSRSASAKARARSGKSNGAQRVDSAKRAVEHTAKDAGQTVSRAASKAKVPLMAGGAALAGAAGGLAVGVRRGRRQRKVGIVPRRPQVKLRSRDLARAAKNVGTFGAEVGHLASELRRTRETANGGKQARSPVEVVLEGLTARRSRS